jgi:hypothetical protein
LLLTSLGLSIIIQNIFLIAGFGARSKDIHIPDWSNSTFHVGASSSSGSTRHRPLDDGGALAPDLFLRSRCAASRFAPQQRTSRPRG